MNNFFIEPNLSGGDTLDGLHQTVRRFRLHDQNTIGASVSIPLRIFDRNQGEKARTKLDIGKNEKLYDAAEAQVYNDVDSAYYNLVQNLTLLKPYKSKYLAEAAAIRDRMTTAYRNGGASLLDYLDAEKSYRDTRLGLHQYDRLIYDGRGANDECALNDNLAASEG